jgi:FMN phosphatase YigB (HAD superfamily)
MKRKIAGVLLDIGGTLWPDHWPRGDDERIRRVCAAFPQYTAPTIAPMLEGLAQALDTLDGHLQQDTHGLIRAYCAQYGWRITQGEAVLLRRAMCLPALGRTQLFPGAPELLQTIQALGLHCVVVSNAIMRAAEDYYQDLMDLGVAPYIKAVVSSVDAGVRKPHSHIFELALEAGDLAADACVMVGNSEHNDIEPAVALGLHAIRVAIEEPLPRFTVAHHAVGSLGEVAAILESMAGN